MARLLPIYIKRIECSLYFSGVTYFIIGVPPFFLFEMIKLRNVRTDRFRLVKEVYVIHFT